MFPPLTLEIVEEINDVGNEAFHTALSSLNSWEEAEDAAQHTIGVYLSQLRSGNRVKNPKAWARKCVKNMIVDNWRKSELLKEYVRSEVINLMGGSSDENSQSSILWEVFIDQLTVLDDIEKEIVLHILTGRAKSIAEASELCGVKSSSVRTRIRKKLRKTFAVAVA